MSSYEFLPCKLSRILKSKTAPKILIKRKLGGIGDVLMSTPLLRKIKELFPDCELTYATDLKYANGALKEIIDHCPFVDKLEHWKNVSDKLYDFVSDITVTGLKREIPGTIPSNRIDMFAEEAGVDVSDCAVPVYVIKDSERECAEQLLDTKVSNWREKDIIFVQTKSNDVRRTWPMESVKELIRDLASKGHTVFVFDWKDGKIEIEETDLIYTFFEKSIPITAAIMELCSVVVCPDSAMLHLAGALNKKTVSIFGPIPAASRINHYPNTEAIQLDLPCSKCWYCPKCLKRATGRLECLTNITAEMVSKAVCNKLVASIKSIPSLVVEEEQLFLVRRSTRGIGDILMSTPGIYELKKNNPKCKIHVACPAEVHDILKNNPSIDKIIDTGKSIDPSKYHRVFDISMACSEYEVGCRNAGLPIKNNRTEVFAATMGFNKPESIVPRYYPTEDELRFGKLFIKNTFSNKKKTICFNLFSNELYRDWPVEYHSKLFESLKDDFNLIVLWRGGGHPEKFTVEPKEVTLRERIGILAASDLLVTVDTSFLHIAAALNKPTVAIFGPIDYKARCRGYEKATVIIAKMPCIPCWRHGASKCAVSGRIKGYSECMTAVPPTTVEKVIREKLNASNG